VRIVDVVFDSRILTNTAHAYSVGAVAVYVRDEDVRGVGLGTEAVVSDVDPGIANCQTIHIVRVPAVGVFGEIL
jgi:hypothetical protein